MPEQQKLLADYHMEHKRYPATSYDRFSYTYHLNDGGQAYQLCTRFGGKVCVTNLDGATKRDELRRQRAFDIVTLLGKRSQSSGVFPDDTHDAYGWVAGDVFHLEPGTTYETDETKKTFRLCISYETKAQECLTEANLTVAPVTSGLWHDQSITFAQGGTVTVSIPPALQSKVNWANTNGKVTPLSLSVYVDGTSLSDPFMLMSRYEGEQHVSAEALLAAWKQAGVNQADQYTLTTVGAYSALMIRDETRDCETTACEQYYVVAPTMTLSITVRIDNNELFYSDKIAQQILATLVVK
jgi:hypothetical protein